MKRRENWPDILASFVESRRCAPFKWGENDCCLFAADAIQAMTGEDLARGVRGYVSALGAARTVKQFGNDVMAIPEAHGLSRITKTMARRGDLVAAHTGSGSLVALGVCLGAVSAFVAKDGIGMIETNRCLAAWRI